MNSSRHLERLFRRNVIGDADVVVDNVLSYKLLIDNAARYTPKNGSIIVSAVPEKDRMMVSISDTGSGIPQEDIPHLFDRLSKRDRLPG